MEAPSSTDGRVCPACRQGRHDDCVDFDDSIVERRGALLEYRVEVRAPICLCRDADCAERHRGLAEQASRRP